MAAPWYSWVREITWGRMAFILLCLGMVLDQPFITFISISPYATNNLFVTIPYWIFSVVNYQWANHVSKIMPNPYLDEVFHIPQAQAYCNGQYNVWDPKLTTPPGLYIIPAIIRKLMGMGRYHQCGVQSLRVFNGVALWVGLGYVVECRARITTIWKASWEFWASRKRQSLSIADMHTAINICLFPPLFFFTGLYYTDVLSTVIVLRTYRQFLQRAGAYKNSAEGLFWIYILGMAALTLRQTNIFWVAVFLGGLELVRTLNFNKIPAAAVEPTPSTWKEAINIKYSQWSRGYIHDVRLNDAGVHDFVLCAVSIAIATTHQPLLVIRRLWPYIALLISFGAFVYWNGGVVLGDKSNHVATIHLPQMLYIWPFITFFSFPIILPPLLYSLKNTVSLLRLPSFPRLRQKFVLATGYISISLISTLVIIKYNTIIHPFTLADNRHYMFYVFRYTILRHPLIRYLLAPIYLICAWGVYITICAQSVHSIHPDHPESNNEVLLSEAFNFDSAQQNPTSKTRTISTEKGLSQPIQKVQPEDKISTEVATRGPTTSFVLILLLTTSFSLITAPLVEPRYFILPWILWRLNLPSMSFPAPALSEHQLLQQDQALQATRKRDDDIGKEEEEGWVQFEDGEGLKKKLVREWKEYDYRLFAETAWFAVVNGVTMWVFLNKGFSWPQEPGNVQRFMW